MPIKQIVSYQVFEKSLEEKEALLFKHSKTCPISANALRQYEEFMEQFPDFPCYILYVQDVREISNKIANELNIRHQSPQIIYMKEGKAIENESHGKIKCELIEEWIR